MKQKALNTFKLFQYRSQGKIFDGKDQSSKQIAKEMFSRIIKIIKVKTIPLRRETSGRLIGRLNCVKVYGRGSEKTEL